MLAVRLDDDLRAYLSGRKIVAAHQIEAAPTKSKVITDSFPTNHRKIAEHWPATGLAHGNGALVSTSLSNNGKAERPFRPMFREHAYRSTDLFHETPDQAEAVTLA